MSGLNGSMVEDAALTWLGELGYAVGHGPHLAPGESDAERDTFGEVGLVRGIFERKRFLDLLQEQPILSIATSLSAN